MQVLAHSRRTRSVATALVIGVGIALGFRPTAGLLEWLGAIGMVALYILAITAVFALGPASMAARIPAPPAPTMTTSNWW